LALTWALLYGFRRVEGPVKLSGGLLMVEVEVDGGRAGLKMAGGYGLAA
jgi:hypothetical protein